MKTAKKILETFEYSVDGDDLIIREGEVLSAMEEYANQFKKKLTETEITLLVKKIYDENVNNPNAFFVEGVRLGIKAVTAEKEETPNLTLEKFNKQGFGAKDEAIYKGKKYKVASVDFDEALIGLFLNISGGEPGDVSWVRCENVIYVPYEGGRKRTVELSEGI